MDTYGKAIVGILMGLVLWICLQKQERDMALVLTMVVCIMGAGIAIKAISPVLQFLQQLEQLSQLQDGTLGILLKVAAIGFTSELAGLICADSGNAAMEKTIRLLGSVSMLTLSMPVFETLLKLIQEILSSI